MKTCFGLLPPVTQVRIRLTFGKPQCFPLKRELWELVFFWMWIRQPLGSGCETICEQSTSPQTVHVGWLSPRARAGCVCFLLLLLFWLFWLFWWFWLFVFLVNRLWQKLQEAVRCIRPGYVLLRVPDKTLRLKQFLPTNRILPRPSFPKKSFQKSSCLSFQFSRPSKKFRRPQTLLSWFRGRINYYCKTLCFLR